MSLPYWTIYNESCLNVLKHYPKNTFKATITSPPYKTKDGYTPELIKELATVSYEATVDGGLMFMNFASLCDGKDGWGRPFDVYDYLIDANWLPVTTIIWIKSMVFSPLKGKLGKAVSETIAMLGELSMEELGETRRFKKMRSLMATLSLLMESHQIGHYTPIDDARRVNNLFEYVHVFAKAPLPKLDRWTPPLGVPYTDKTNLKRGNRGKHGDVHCGGNIWFIPYDTRSGPKNAHPHEYPLELVTRCLTLAKIKSTDVIFEPFCGGGSTLIASKSYGCSAVGYEIDPTTAEKARQRIIAYDKVSEEFASL